MAHGGGGDGEGGGERWLVSYADFITLLMVLFVVLYSMGQVDVEKYKRLAENMRMAFTLGGPSQVIDSQINQSGGTSEDGEPKPIIVPGIPESPPASAEVAGQLTQMLAGTGLGNEVSVQTNIEGVLISLSEKLIFSPGSSELPPEAMPVLETIVHMVRTIDNPIRLVGHTDDSPSTDPRYPTNWDLSVARASHVAQYLINAGIDPQRLIVSGRSQYDPIFPNDTNEHRSMNSRVDIIIVYEVENNIFGSQTINIAP